MAHLFTNIKELIGVKENPVSFRKGKEMKTLPTIKDAYLRVEDDKIIDFGKMDDLSMTDIAEAAQITECTKTMILPSWCDSHTHIVYAGNREQEFVDRINGLTYEDIANRGGGILNSAEKLQNTSEEDLYQQSAQRLKNIIKLGTGAVEIKSGYGLTVD